MDTTLYEQLADKAKAYAATAGLSDKWAYGFLNAMWPTVESVDWESAAADCAEERRALRAENERLVDLLRSSLAVLRRIHRSGFNPAILDRLHEALVDHKREPQA